MDEYWFCDWEPSERWPHYTRANAGEVLAPPASPLGQTFTWDNGCLLYTSPSPRDDQTSRMPSSA